MSGKRTFFAIVILAFVTRLLLLLYFPLHYTDYYLINTAAQNLVDGHGMGFFRSDSNDLSNLYFEGLRLWPPLVPFVTAVFIKITGSIAITDIVLSILLLITLFIYLNKLFTLLKISAPTQFVGYLFIATNPEIIKQPGLSDLASATFSIAACLYLFKLITASKKQTYLTLLLYGIFFFLPSAFRYQFYPLSVFFPVALFVSGYLLKDRALKKQGILLLLFVSLLIFTQEIFLFFYTAQPLTQSVSMDSRGIFFYNLNFIYPFFLKTFVNFSYIENTLPYVLKYFGNLYSLLISALFLFWLVVLTRYAGKKYSAKAKTTEQREPLSIIILLLVVVIPPLILTALSLMYNSRTGLPGGWTYVKEGRYYIVSSLLILILSLWYVQNRIAEFSKLVRTAGSIFLGGMLLYNTLLTLKFYYNIYNKNIPDKEITNRADRTKIEHIVDTLSNNGITTVICSNEPYFAYYSFKPNVATTQKTDELILRKIQTTKKTQLLLVAQKPISGADSLLIAQTNAKEVASLSTTILFLAVILPSTQQNN